MKPITRAIALSLPIGLAVAIGVATQAQNSVNTAIKGEITIWGWKDPLGALKTVDDAFSKAYPNISLKYVQKSPADAYQALKLSVSAGSGAPDVVLLEDSNLAQFVSLEALADITSQTKPYIKKMNSYKWNAATLKGRVYSMPWDSGPVAMYYRRDIFQKAGVDISSIKTWDDYLKAAKVIKAKTGVKMLPLAKARNDARFFETLLWQQGIGYTNRDGAVILDKDVRAKVALDLVSKLFKDDLTADFENWTDPWYKTMAEGEIATLPMASWMGGFLKGWIAPKTSGQWGVAPLPTFTGSKARASNDGGSHLAISSSSKNKEAAWAYIEYHLGRPESQLTMYKAADLFPSLESTYADPIFNEPDAFFGGQKSRQIFAEAVKTVPNATVYTADYPEINRLMAIELQKMALGSQSVSDTLANAAKLVRDRTRRK